MLTVVWVIQIISAILLTIFVLMHSPKGDGLAAIGGMANLFSSQKTAESGLNRLTANLGLIFIVTSFITGFHVEKFPVQLIVVLSIPVVIAFAWINRVK